MNRLNQVVLDWNANTVVTISVSARPRAGSPTGEEWRLAQEIAAHIWAAWHLPEVTTPPEV